MNKIFIVVTVGPDYQLLPKFLRYYKNLGIKNFLVILNTLDQLPLEILKQEDIVPEKIWSEPFSEASKQYHERIAILKNCNRNDWVIYADLDEYQYYPMSLIEHIKFCENNKINFLEGLLIDRISQSGELIKIDQNKSLEEQFPLRGFITNNLLKAWDKKIVLAKARLVVGGGHHIFLESTTYKTLPYDKELNENSLGIEVHHFKWDKRAFDRMNDYLNLPDDSLKAWREEIGRFLKYISEHKKIDIQDKIFKIEINKIFINI